MEIERGETRPIRHNTMRKAIARRLVESKTSIPHFYVTVECSADALLNFRAAQNDVLRNASTTIKLSVNDILIAAVAQTLLKVPEMNAWWGEEAITRHGSAHIGVAVATDRGLYVPVIRFANELPLTDISAAMAANVEKAKSGGFIAADYDGGTFSVSNLGMLGIDSFTAIINPPQVGILAIGAIRGGRPDGSGSSGERGARLTLTLSADHRAVDGAVAARFLGELRRLIEQPNFQTGNDR